MKKQRRKHTAEFKARVALEALKGIETINQIASKYEIHPAQVSNWKRELQERLSEVFDRKDRSRHDKEEEKEHERYERKIGQQAMEIDWLKKNLQKLESWKKEK